jgi:hypothetical protein
MLLLIIKLLSREVVIFHIRIYKGAKRRSWRKTSLLLHTPHVFVLLGLTIVEVRHEPLKRMVSGIHGTMPTAMPTPTPSRDLLHCCCSILIILSCTTVTSFSSLPFLFV